MNEQDYAVAKLEVFLEVLDSLIDETLAAGVPETAMRRTLLARAVYQFKDAPSEGLAAIDHFRPGLARSISLGTA